MGLRYGSKGAGSSPPSQSQYFVTAGGNDSNPGTMLLPWATITKVNSHSYLPGDTISFNGGDRFQGTLAITSSGSSSSPITITSYGTGNATISGGVVVTGWTQTDATKNIWRASFSASVGKCRNLWVNGIRCTRPYKYFPAGVTSNGTGLDTSASNIPGFLSGYANQSDIEVLLRMNWEEQRAYVSSVSGNTITMATNSWAQITALYAATNILTIGHALYAAENALEILEEQASARTFYQDRTNNYLYLVPPFGIDPTTATVIAPVLEQVVSLDTVTDITVTGLNFSHTTALQADTSYGWPDLQIGVNYTWPGQTDGVVANRGTPIASIVANNCTRILFIRNVVQAIGAVGIAVQGPSALNCQIVGNVIQDISMNGIQNGYAFNVSGGPTGTLINNNIVRRTGIEFRGSCGIAHLFGLGVDINNNLVYDVPYTGISVGLGWKMSEPHINSATVQSNHVYHCMQTMNDGAGIYSNSYFSSSLISGNYIHDIGQNGTVWGGSVFTNTGLYLDDGSENVTMNGNVLHGIGGNYLILVNDTYGGNTIENTTCDAGTITAVGGSTGVDVLNPPTQVGLSAAITAGLALNAGLQSAYADLATSFPDPNYNDFRNGLLFEFSADDSSPSISSTAITKIISSYGHRDLLGAAQFNPNTLNGLATINISGSQTMALADSMVASNTPQYDGMWVIVWRFNTAANVAGVVFDGQPGANGLSVYNFSGSRTAATSGITSFADGNETTAWETWLFLMNQSFLLSFRINGAATNLGTSVPHAPQKNFSLAGANVDIAMIRCYQRTLSTPNCQKVEALVTAKYFP